MDDGDFARCPRDVEGDIREAHILDDQLVRAGIVFDHHKHQHASHSSRTGDDEHVSKLSNSFQPTDENVKGTIPVQFNSADEAGMRLTTAPCIPRPSRTLPGGNAYSMRQRGQQANIRPQEVSRFRRSSRTPSDLKPNGLTHTGCKLFQCSCCAKSFSNRHRLAVHMHTHTGSRPYKCPHCPRAFSQSGNRNQHARIHTGETPYKCPHCPKSFSRAGTLTYHIHVHSREAPYSCPRCPKAFPQAGTLRKHLRTHTDEIASKFPQCPEWLRQSRSLTKHVQAQTGGATTRSRNCTRRTASSPYLRNIDQRPVKCHYCSKKYSIFHFVPKLTSFT